MKPEIYWRNGKWRCLGAYRKFYIRRTVVCGAGDTPYEAWHDWAGKVPFRVAFGWVANFS